MTAKHTALVLGASGIIGRNLLEYLDQREAWQVKAIARRAPGFETKADLRSIDLLNPDAIAAASDWLKDVTHIFYAAYQEHPSPADQSKYNVGMLRNIVEAVEKEKDSAHVPPWPWIPVGFGLKHLPLPDMGQRIDIHLDRPAFGIPRARRVAC